MRVFRFIVFSVVCLLQGTNCLDLLNGNDIRVAIKVATRPPECFKVKDLIHYANLKISNLEYKLYCKNGERKFFATVSSGERSPHFEAELKLGRDHNKLTYTHKGLGDPNDPSAEGAYYPFPEDKEILFHGPYVPQHLQNEKPSQNIGTVIFDPALSKNLPEYLKFVWDSLQSNRNRGDDFTFLFDVGITGEARFNFKRKKILVTLRRTTYLLEGHVVEDQTRKPTFDPNQMIWEGVSSNWGAIQERPEKLARTLSLKQYTHMGSVPFPINLFTLDLDEIMGEIMNIKVEDAPGGQQTHDMEGESNWEYGGVSVHGETIFLASDTGHTTKEDGEKKPSLTVETKDPKYSTLYYTGNSFRRKGFINKVTGSRNSVNPDITIRESFSETELPDDKTMYVDYADMDKVIKVLAEVTKHPYIKHRERATVFVRYKNRSSLKLTYLNGGFEAVCFYVLRMKQTTDGASVSPDVSQLAYFKNGNVMVEVKRKEGTLREERDEIIAIRLTTNVPKSTNDEVVRAYIGDESREWAYSFNRKE